MSETIVNVDELVEKLDAAYPSVWELWRTALGGWCVRIRKGGSQEVFNETSIAIAMQKAIEHRWIPVFVRRPELVDAAEFRIVKAAIGTNRWEVYNGNWLLHRMPTKKAAEAQIERHVKLAKERVVQWDRDILPQLSGKIEGVDFRYC